jgi:AcrR family transcriptional regulator
MDAGERVLAEKGYLATTIDDIGSEAGTSRATFYLHFSSKNELMKALLDRHLAAGLERFALLDEILLLTGEEGRAAMRQWLAEWLDIWRRGAQVYASVTQAAAADPELAHSQIQNGPVLIGSLEHAAWMGADGQSEDRRERALMLELMTRRLLLVVSTGLLELSSDDVLLDFLTELWWDAFHGPSSAGDR